MIKKISEQDKKDWEEFLSNKDKLPNKDIDEKDKDNFNFTTLDLHGYTLRDANIAVKNLIIKSYNSNLKKIVIITGKGLRSKNYNDPYKSNKLSILKYSVPDFIKNDPGLIKLIKNINTNEIEDLNSGNFTIFLKTKKK